MSMSDSQKPFHVNTPLRGQQIAEFEQVKRHLGIDSNAGVVRFLIRQEARRISGSQSIGRLDQILDAYLLGRVTAEEAMSAIVSRERSRPL
jgi:hypothetical protein